MAPPLKSISEHMKNYQLDSKGCWIFGGNHDKNGYGIFMHGRGKQLRAHRVSFEFHHGGLNAEMLVCHSCDNPSCINPNHLFMGTPKDNTQDMIKKGRRANQKGSKHPSAKLNEDQICLIKNQRSSGKTLKDIASQFNVSFQAISSICKGKSWTHTN